ncbi:hypothetical protein [Streptomyces sp. AP-93]|uniref:hypothetical protein n=1 Tax=Streptomyces sp. AP-93 TaxID=2929048 RepID=UPI001FAFAE09|nr:hypothetical protein [Streptomyces sp. AP-93]MCJ0868065.1 hypothetical protein [Streptomyces sp. AP-93]
MNASVFQQLELDIPLGAGRGTLTTADRLRAAELRARQAHRRAARTWHGYAAEFFGGLR